ncbi:MAG TPA: DUF4111 domain-containing protein [Anaerolinea thermolimosa]|uniref:DUF4111 domain-containing protein n=2 Tax=Anaerolinea thermolimosa TaxID=229919 RepID=A0A3D1JIA9_9CHLR|nr:predicted nucleotidyltransferases [Anaerolinea thermolimosa]HCE18233.1 DUF4111 domain-containing protein [Anaerolinea thermolimosa]
MYFSMTLSQPTPDPQLNAILHQLVTSVREVLGERLVAAYLQGSFATGGWDRNSDVDFLFVVEEDLPETLLPRLQDVHVQIYEIESYWAKHLEGSYFPREWLKSPDPSCRPIVYIDNGSRELVRSAHDNTLVVRWVVRECGITLAGPPPTALIDPVSADDLRREVFNTMRDWGQEIRTHQYQINNRWAQPFAVISYCRMLHTLHTGRVDSKPAGVRWGLTNLDPRWAGLIQRAWNERPDQYLKVHLPADPGDLAQTLEFIEDALALGETLLDL